TKAVTCAVFAGSPGTTRYRASPLGSTLGLTLQTRWRRHHHRAMPAKKRMSAMLAPTIAARAPAFCKVEILNTAIHQGIFPRRPHGIRFDVKRPENAERKLGEAV